MKPKRIQRRRVKGWRMPERAVYVGRPSDWGNPFRVGEPVTTDSPLWPYIAASLSNGQGLVNLTPLDQQQVVDLYSSWVIEVPSLMLNLDKIAGKDLVCWCRPDQPCHGDFLLELANQPAAVGAR